MGQQGELAVEQRLKAAEMGPHVLPQGAFALPLAAPVDEGAEPARISLEAEVPEVLFDGMRDFIRAHPQWDQYRLITSALASFLFQNGCTEASVTQHYLSGLFLR